MTKSGPRAPDGAHPGREGEDSESRARDSTRRTLSAGSWSMADRELKCQTAKVRRSGVGDGRSCPTPGRRDKCRRWWYCLEVRIAGEEVVLQVQRHKGQQPVLGR